MRNVLAVCATSVAIVLGIALIWYSMRPPRQPAPPMVAKPALQAAPADTTAPPTEPVRQDRS